jgi:hypothetical protein
MAQEKPKHDFRWEYKLEHVTVTCKVCDVSVTFDQRAEFDRCIQWCNEHQIPQELRDQETEAVSSETMRHLQTAVAKRPRVSVSVEDGQAAPVLPLPA